MSQVPTKPRPRPKPHEVRRIRGSRGWVDVGILAPGLIYELAEGHATGDLAQPLCARLDELVARYGKIETFNDWYGLTGYDAEARRLLQDWSVQNRSSIVRGHVLFSSRLVAMGVTVSNLLTNGMTETYADRAEFERVVDEALGRR